MDTARYLSVCLNTLNLPFVLQNESHEVTKYLKKLSTIPTSMQLADGYPLQTHLELMAEANPSQKYLLSKQGYSYENFKAEVLKFQRSKGYADLVYEYKAVGTDIKRPHQFLQKNQPEVPQTPTEPAIPEMPATLVEPPQPEVSPAPAPTEAPPSPPPTNEAQGQGRPNQHMSSQTTYPTPAVKPEPTPTAAASTPAQTIPGQRTPIQRPPIRSRTLPPTVVATPPARSTFRQPLPQPIQKAAIPTQGQVRPNRNIPSINIPQPIKSGLKSAGSGLGIFTQRAANVTVPNIIGGFAKTTGSALLGFIPGARVLNRGASSGVTGMFRGGGSGGGGRGSFMRQALPIPAGGRSWMWILLLLLLFIFIFAFFFGGELPLSNNADIKNIEITKTAPKEVDNGAKITYSITVRNKGTKTAQVVVTDAIPENTTYDSGNNDPIATASGTVANNLKWTLNSLAGGQVSNLTFTVVPTKEDTWIINQAKANVTIAGSGQSGGGGPVAIPGNIPPTQDNCGGKWTFKTPLGNYGDPTCNFSKDDLHTLLRQLDPANADYWFFTVIRCESAYDPNNFLGASASGKGAYGLYQMNPSGQGNGEYDAGNVIWQLQTSNAINYNNLITKSGLAWRYWHCALDRW